MYPEVISRIPRGPGQRGRPESDPSPNCPGCGAPLEIWPVGPSDPGRFVGACEALQCGEVVIFRMLEQRFIVEERHRPARRPAG